MKKKLRQADEKIYEQQEEIKILRTKLFKEKQESDQLMNKVRTHLGLQKTYHLTRKQK